MSHYRSETLEGFDSPVNTNNGLPSDFATIQGSILVCFDLGRGFIRVESFGAG